MGSLVLFDLSQQSQENQGSLMTGGDDGPYPQSDPETETRME